MSCQSEQIEMTQSSYSSYGQHKKRDVRTQKDNHVFNFGLGFVLFVLSITSIITVIGYLRHKHLAEVARTNAESARRINNFEWAREQHDKNTEELQLSNDWFTAMIALCVITVIVSVVVSYKFQDPNPSMLTVSGGGFVLLIVYGFANFFEYV